MTYYAHVQISALALCHADISRPAPVSGVRLWSDQLRYWFGVRSTEMNPNKSTLQAQCDADRPDAFSVTEMPSQFLLLLHVTLQHISLGECLYVCSNAHRNSGSSHLVLSG